MKKWRRVLAAVLVVVLVIGLCACGKGDESGSGGQGGKGGKGGKGVRNDPSLAKQYVYRLQEFDLSSVQLDNGDSYMQSCRELNGKIYFVMQTYNYAMEMGENMLYRLVVMNMDGSDQKIYKLQWAPEGQEGSEREGLGLDSDSQTGNTAHAEEAEEERDELDDVNIPVDDSFIIDDPMSGGNFYEYTGFGNFQITEAGYLYGTKNYNYEDYSDPANYVSIRKMYVCCWDMEGKMLWQMPIEDLQTEDSWSYIMYLMGMPDGTVTLFIGGDKSGLMTVGTDGTVSGIKPMPDELGAVMERNAGQVGTKNGLLLMYYDENWQGMNMVNYDMAAGKVSEPIKIPTAISYNGGLGNATTDAAGDLLYCNSQGVFKWRLGSEESVQLMSFVNSDLEINGLNQLLPIDDEHFIGLYSEYDEEAYHSMIKGGLFTKVDPADIPDKEVMILAGNYIPYDLRKRAINFNKTSETHRIILKDYSQYISYDDYSAGLTQLNNDIISGNMPDILVVEGYSDMVLDSYISKKLLADIGKLIQEDEELSKVEFMENVFDACKVNGKLYEIIPTFQVITYVGKTSLVGERPNGWTTEEARALVDSMPEGTKLFSDTSQTGFIYVLMEQCGSDFVDVSTGKCNFNTPEFISLLEYAKTMPTDEQINTGWDDENWESWYKSYQSQYRENRTILSNCYIGSMQNLVNVINGSFGEDVSYVGFPGSVGTGGVIRTNETYALSAKSANLDAAWKFMRYYLTDEYLNTVEWQLPVVKKKFEENAQKATQKPYYMDNNGEKIEYEYTYWMSDEEIILEPLNQQQVDKAKDFISSVKKRNYSNSDVMKIISEEIEAYFKGDKSAADVAGIIQSRVQLYVNENR